MKIEQFLDLGTNFGQGLAIISKREKLDEKVKIHTFEANPYIRLQESPTL